MHLHLVVSTLAFRVWGASHCDARRFFLVFLTATATTYSNNNNDNRNNDNDNKNSNNNRKNRNNDNNSSTAAATSTPVAADNGTTGQVSGLVITDAALAGALFRRGAFKAVRVGSGARPTAATITNIDIRVPASPRLVSSMIRIF